MQTNQAQKQREIDAAWEQHRNPRGTRIPTEREIWEREERKRNKGKI
jgi:hypothetical protein